MLFSFFFQAGDGIRGPLVTGVQTCALPILPQQSATRATPETQPTLRPYRIPTRRPRSPSKRPRRRAGAIHGAVSWGHHTSVPSGIRCPPGPRRDFPGVILPVFGAARGSDVLAAIDVNLGPVQVRRSLRAQHVNDLRDLIRRAEPMQGNLRDDLLGPGGQDRGVDLAGRDGIDADPLRAEVVCHLTGQDRKSTRLNSSHEWISYAVFCLKKKNSVV